MPSFDVVSRVDLHEVKNAVEQVRKEIGTRYDFRGAKASIELTEEKLITLLADDQMKLTAMQEMARTKLSKRGVSLKSVEFGEPEPAGGDCTRQRITVKDGLTPEVQKKITKVLKESKLKVQGAIQGDEVRVSGKQRDELQSAIALLRSSCTEVELQFVNFRE